MQSQAGFTIVEMMMTAIIFSAFIAIIFAAFSVGDLSWRFDMAQLDIFQPLRLAMEGMVREIRGAAPASVTFPGGPSVISFTMGASNIEYYVSDGDLIREHPGGTTKILAHNVTALNFNQTDSVITVTVQASKTVSGSSIGVALKEKARMRNGS